MRRQDRHQERRASWPWTQDSCGSDSGRGAPRRRLPETRLAGAASRPRSGGRRRARRPTAVLTAGPFDRRGLRTRMSTVANLVAEEATIGGPPPGAKCLHPLGLRTLAARSRRPVLPSDRHNWREKNQNPRGRPCVKRNSWESLDPNRASKSFDAHRHPQVAFGRHSESSDA